MLIVKQPKQMDSIHVSFLKMHKKVRKCKTNLKISRKVYDMVIYLKKILKKVIILV